MNRRRKKGFTLLELLAVLAIMAVVLVFALPATTRMFRGNALTQASQMMTDRLSLARQTAISGNHPVEVRFYQYADPQIPGESANSPATWRYHAVQVFQVVSANNIVALEKVQALPQSVIVDSGTSLSSLLAMTKTPGQILIPRVDKNYKYVSFRFNPDGSTDLLPTSDWFFTLHAGTDGDAMTAPPANFVTLDIDPVNGTLKVFRPGV